MERKRPPFHLGQVVQSQVLRVPTSPRPNPEGEVSSVVTGCPEDKGKTKNKYHQIFDRAQLVDHIPHKLLKKSYARPSAAKRSKHRIKSASLNMSNAVHSRSPRAGIFDHHYEPRRGSEGRLPSAQHSGTLPTTTQQYADMKQHHRHYHLERQHQQDAVFYGFAF